MPLTADGPMSRAGLPPPKGPGWTDRVRAPERLDEGLDEFGNRVTGKWMPKGIDQDLWEQIRGATIEGYLGTQSKVLKGFTRACVYTRDCRDFDDLRRILTVLRKLGVRGWIDYKRDCDTARGLYGRGALYWQAPPGTVAIDVPPWSVGREMDREPAPAAAAPAGTDTPCRTGRCPKCLVVPGEGCQKAPPVRCPP
ncbi:putative phosphothreonine lyase domain-containing protein [Streptomyces anulatus]